MDVSPNSIPLGSVSGEIKINGAFLRFDFCIREPFMNSFFNPRLLFGPLQPAVDPAADGVEQFQPVFQRWIGDGLPLFETTVAHKELPAVADVLRIDLDALALVGAPLPTDLSLGHSLLFRAINARHRHGCNAFLAPDESKQLVGGRLDADAVHIDF